MAKLLEREYYKIGVAAEQVGCTVDDMIHWAATGRIELGVLFEVDGFTLERYSYYQSPWDTVEEFTGFAYVAKGYFKGLELNSGELQFNSVRLMDGRIILKEPKGDDFGVETRSLEQIYIHSNDLGALLSAGVPTAAVKSDCAYVSDKLATMNQAAKKFWENADRNDRGTQPENAKVAAWLLQHDFSPTLADKAATIIRPEWAPVGRKPEE